LPRLQRATDKVILIVLIVVYWLQVLDKTVLGYTAACVPALSLDLPLWPNLTSFLFPYAASD